MVAILAEFIRRNQVRGHPRPRGLADQIVASGPPTSPPGGHAAGRRFVTRDDARPLSEAGTSVEC
jgi:hypothetical protein